MPVHHHFFVAMPPKRSRKRPRDDPLSGFAVNVVAALVIPWLRDAGSLVTLARVCQDFYRSIKDLPPSHGLMLQHASKLLEGVPLPIGRSLFILTQRRCELCGRKDGKRAMCKPYYVYAHAECFAAQLCPIDHSGSAAQLQAADAPVVYTKSESLVWRSALVVPGRPAEVWTAEGAAKLTLEQAVIAGNIATAVKKRLWEEAMPALERADVLNYAESRMMQQRKQQATEARIKLLEETLLTLGMPALIHGEDLHGPRCNCAWNCVSGWYALRATAPYSLEQAVQRVRRWLICKACFRRGVVGDGLGKLVAQVDVGDFTCAPWEEVADCVFKAAETTQCIVV